MMIFFENGRLGNQLFQYAALKTLFPKEKLVLLGFEDLEEVVENVDAIFINKSRLPRWFFFGLVKRFLSALGFIRVIGRIRERQNQEKYELEKKAGLITPIFQVDKAFFQHQFVNDRLNCDLQIKPSLVRAAQEWLASLQRNSITDQLVFVHIRRGDYLFWPSSKSPAVLNLHWYQKAMDLLRKKIDSPLFVVLTDDANYAMDVFSEQADVVLSTNGPHVDFAIMSECDNGILSASSFAWWGAWLARQRTQNEGAFVAPKYWACHRKKEWFPPGFVSDWLTYIE